MFTNFVDEQKLSGYSLKMDSMLLQRVGKAMVLIIQVV